MVVPPTVVFGACWASSLKKLHRHHKLLLCPLFSNFTTVADPHNEKQSRSLPPPIQVSFTQSAGRGVFATRRIGAGDLIHTAKPFIAHPSLSLLHSVCYVCLRKLNLGSKSPSQSQAVNFCSEECIQNSKDFYEVEKQVNWSAYREHCIQRGLKYPLLVKRLACMVISGAASADSLDILQPARLLPEMILEIEEEFGLLKSILMKTNVKVEQMAFLARIRINAFRVELAGGSYEDLLLSAAASVEAEAAVGNAIYILPSFYNHDCDPNVHIVWMEDANARLKALREIEAGEELRICYIDASMGHGARQMILFEGFGFQCNCLRCMSGD